MRFLIHKTHLGYRKLLREMIETDPIAQPQVILSTLHREQDDATAATAHCAARHVQYLRQTNVS